jgi:hypothetical protein
VIRGDAGGDADRPAEAACTKKQHSAAKGNRANHPYGAYQA